MAKTENVYARIEPEIKEEAEKILADLGIPVSNAINMFYRQIIINNGLPFEVKLGEKPSSIYDLSEEELDREIEKGYEDIEKGKGYVAEEVIKYLEEKYSL